MKKMLSVLLATFSWVTMCIGAEGTISATGMVNLRMKPTIQSPVVGSVSGGDKVVVQEVDGNWVKIAAPAGVRIYLSEVQVVNDKTRAELNMRTQMSSTSASFGVLPAGSTVKVLPERSHGWVRIAPPENLSVYVARVYVDFDASAVPNAVVSKDAASAPETAKPVDVDKVKDEAKPAEQPVAEAPAQAAEAK